MSRRTPLHCSSRNFMRTFVGAKIGVSGSFGMAQSGVLIELFMCMTKSVLFAETALSGLPNKMPKRKNSVVHLLSPPSRNFVNLTAGMQSRQISLTPMIGLSIRHLVWPTCAAVQWRHQIRTTTAGRSPPLDQELSAAAGVSFLRK